MNRDVEEFLSSHKFAETTKVQYGRVLEELVLLDLSAMTAADLLRFVSRPTWGSAARYAALAACRRFIGWMYGVQHPALYARVKRSKGKIQRVLSVDAALKLLASFDTSTVKGRRDLALCALALDTGLRCSELCRLRLADVDVETRTLQVMVKGGQWGRAVYSEQTALYLADYLVVRSSSAPTVFVSTRSNEPLTREGLKKIVRDWGLVVGLKLSPHDFRRSFATLSTIFGAPSRVVQAAGRWSNIGMVEHYTASIQADEIAVYLPLSNLNPKR